MQQKDKNAQRASMMMEKRDFVTMEAATAQRIARTMCYPLGAPVGLRDLRRRAATTGLWQRINNCVEG